MKLKVWMLALVCAWAGQAGALPQASELAYGTDRQQRLDVYARSGMHRAPVVIMVHGGAWRVGDKRSGNVVQNKGEHWVAQGIVFVSLNYRLKVDPLTQADDVARALAYVQTHAEELGGDPERVILAGHSAGAHLVSLLSANPARAFAQGARSWRGSISLDSAAMDIVGLMSAPHYRFYNPVFGTDRQYWEQASPYHQLSGNAVPMLVVCSSVRRDQPCRQAEAFARKATQLGGSVTVLAQAREHDAINNELGLPGEYTEAVDLFLEEILQGRH
jgi:acetyl esterase/lipase